MATLFGRVRRNSISVHKTMETPTTTTTTIVIIICKVLFLQIGVVERNAFLDVRANQNWSGIKPCHQIWQSDSKLFCSGYGHFSYFQGSFRKYVHISCNELHRRSSLDVLMRWCLCGNEIWRTKSLSDVHAMFSNISWKIQILCNAWKVQLIPQY